MLSCSVTDDELLLLQCDLDIVVAVLPWRRVPLRELPVPGYASVQTGREGDALNQTTQRRPIAHRGRQSTVFTSSCVEIRGKSTTVFATWTDLGRIEST